MSTTKALDIDALVASLDLPTLVALTREDCPTCAAAAREDELGRMPIGWCGPGCLMAKRRDRMVELRSRTATVTATKTDGPGRGNYVRCAESRCRLMADTAGRCFYHQPG